MIKHSKYRNTGIIFEMLVRQLTNETISNKEPKAINIIKKYFTKTELAKENKLYQTIIQSNNLSESKAEVIIGTVCDLSKKLDRSKINKEKYNLIKEIKNNYELESFFKTSINNYKSMASIFTLIESTINENPNPNTIINSKLNLLEHLTENKIAEETQIYKDLSTMEKGERFLVYKVMIESFNSKYDNLDSAQKLILKEYINNISDTVKLKEFVDNQFSQLQNSLREHLSKIDDQITKIKIEETIKMIDPIIESKKMKDDYIVSLFQYQELNKELSKL